MIPVPAGVQVWLATGHTDMRKGFDGLALLVQETLKRNPHNGHLFVFRGRRANQGALARRSGHVSVRETAGTRPLRMAIDGSPGQRRTNGDDYACATGIFVGRHRLAFAAAHLAPASGGMIAVRDWWVTRARSCDSISGDERD
jgi:transposase